MAFYTYISPQLCVHVFNLSCVSGLNRPPLEFERRCGQTVLRVPNLTADVDGAGDLESLQFSLAVFYEERVEVRTQTGVKAEGLVGVSLEWSLYFSYIALWLVTYKWLIHVSKFYN